MASWRELEAAEPELAGRIKAFMDAHVHKTIATLRRDGSPRISGTELRFYEGELWLGSMLGSMKARDLQRDGRFAIHSGSDDPPAWKGDAKLSGRAVEIVDPSEIARINGAEHAGRSHLFRCDIREASIVSLDQSGDALTIERWREGRGVSRLARA